MIVDMFSYLQEQEARAFYDWTECSDKDLMQEKKEAHEKAKTRLIEYAINNGIIER